MWLEHYRTFWNDRLAALETFLLRRTRAPKPGTPSGG